MEPTQQSGGSKTVVAILAGIVVVVGGIVAYASGLFNKTTPATNPTTEDNTQQNNTQQQPTASKYKDGTYNLTQTYHSPGGNEQFDLSVTLKDDVITAAQFTPKPVSQIGVKMQSNFNAAFSQQVVGKDIDDVSLTVVNGASLTTKGFMEALTTIKAKASAAS